MERQLDILRIIKTHGGATCADLADQLDVTKQAVRQQLAQLESDGLVNRVPRVRAGRGRPEFLYRLTQAAEDQFPKFYDALTVTIIDSVREKFGADGLRAVLEDITDRQVDEWHDKLSSKPLSGRILALRGIYFDKDPFTEVKSDEEGSMLIEHNCPYLNAALDEPRLCSVTVSTMKRLLGVEVDRTERFQQGDGRCVFRIRADRQVPADFRFDWESPPGVIPRSR